MAVLFNKEHLFIRYLNSINFGYRYIIVFITINSMNFQGFDLINYQLQFIITYLNKELSYYLEKQIYLLHDEEL